MASTAEIQSHASLQSSENRPQSATAQQKKTHDHIGNWGKYWMIFSNQLTKDRCINHCPNFPKCWSTKKIKILLINKKVYQNFIDQQNLQYGKPPECWSTKKLKILLINKISTSNFVDQQNCDFSILSIARGVRPPPRGSARQIFGSHFEP